MIVLEILGLYAGAMVAALLIGCVWWNHGGFSRWNRYWPRTQQAYEAAVAPRKAR